MSPRRLSFPIVILLLMVAYGFGRDEERPWQKIRDLTADRMAKEFLSPPPEYSATITWGWNGPMSKEVIRRDLDSILAKGLRCATIEAGYRMDNAPYLSEDWFRLVRFAAEEAGKRGMRLWIIDEGKYPSGFAGGKFTKERPDLRMQGLGIAERIELKAGERLERQCSKETVGALALNVSNGKMQRIDLRSGNLRFTAPQEGNWQIFVVDHRFRTPVTRAVNDPTQAKTDKNSMGDLLNPEAVRQFIEWTHEGYYRHMSDLFGKVILGFRGDEPDFGSTPWTGDILRLFRQKKGYDITPYLPYLISLPRRNPAPANAGVDSASNPVPEWTEEQRRVRADYWDVWSELFGESFFDLQAEWCREKGVEYQTHLNNDHNLMLLIRSTGDFFAPMRKVQIPGVDVIWSQIYPGRKSDDFPKFASSTAHLYGRPRSLSESFAAFRDPVDLETARWVIDNQLVRGINLMEFMFFPSSAESRPRGEPSNTAKTGTPAGGSLSAVGSSVVRETVNYLKDPGFPALAGYVHRTQYLLSQGRPAASVAVYCPISSMWLGDGAANDSMLKIARQLLERQYDFDFVDERALSSSLRLDRGRWVNQSGQGYRTVILPSITALSAKAVQRLKRFSKTGGRVLFLGNLPSMIVAKSFLKAQKPVDLSWAIHEPSGEFTARVLGAMSPPDVVFDQPSPEVKALHRRLQDADLYFFFHEGKEKITRQADLFGRGSVQLWDADNRHIDSLPAGTLEGGYVRVSLTLNPHQTKILVIRQN